MRYVTDENGSRSRGILAVFAAMLLALSMVLPVVAQDDAAPDETAAGTWSGALEVLGQGVRLGIEVSAVIEAGTEEARWYAGPAGMELEKGAVPAKVIRRGPRSSGAVALTFDDGYNSAACAKIARALRQNGAKGTFFINGNHLRKAPETWRRILKGMSVGNHTRSHLFLTKEPDPVVRRQIRDNETIHEDLLGQPMLKVLRPPYGVYDKRVKRLAAELGYDRIILWSLDTRDWQSGTTARAITRRATGLSPGSVVLMHCTRDETAKALPAIIRHYQQRGIELAGLEDVIKGAKAARRQQDDEGYGGS